MNNKKETIINYIKIVIITIVLMVSIVFFLGKISEKITNKTNEYYMDYFINEVKGFSSPWYERGLHRVDEAFIYSLNKTDENTVYIIGSSLSSNNLNDDTVSFNGYIHKNLVCGNGSYRSNRILYNLLKKLSLCKDKDIVKYEVSFSTFRDVNKTITETVLDKWGKYSVDENLNIIENSACLSPIYAINVELIKIQNVWELITSFWEQNNHKEWYPSPRGYANYKNNYFSYDAVADSCCFMDEYAESVMGDIKDINENYNEVVEISPIPDGLLNTEFGQTLNNFIEDELIPYLNDNNIRYLDLRYDYSDEEFADGVHLSYKATKKYTNTLNEYINSVITEIENGD